MSCGGLGQRQTFEEVGEVGAWFQPVGFGRFDQRVEGGAGPGPAGGETEQPVLATDHEWADGVLGGVVVDGDVAVFQEDRQLRPQVQGIGDRLAEQALGQHPRRLVIQPGLDGVEDGAALHTPLVLALRGGEVLQTPLHGVEFADEPDHLVGGGGVAAPGGGLDELTPHVRPAGGMAEQPQLQGQGAVDAVAIGEQIDFL